MTDTAYQARANLHRPRDPAILGREIRRLSGLGWTPFDIASAMHVAVGTVREALRQPQEHAA